jgi:pimeloyl-ACP methyl ester carboxylesterase
MHLRGNDSHVFVEAAAGSSTIPHLRPAAGGQCRDVPSSEQSRRSAGLLRAPQLPNRVLTAVTLMILALRVVPAAGFQRPTQSDRDAGPCSIAPNDIHAGGVTDPATIDSDSVRDLLPSTASNCCRLHLADRLDPHTKTVLVVHGFHSSSASFALFSERCKSAGIQVISVDYSSEVTLCVAAASLAAELRLLETEYKGVRLAVVAHSAGGLVIRAALELDRGRRGHTCVGDVFFLGTPHHGTHLAAPRGDLEQRIAEALAAVMSSLGSNGHQVSAAVPRELALESPLIQQLARNKPPAGVRYYSLIGTKGLVDARAKSRLHEEWRRQIRRLRLAPAEETATRDLVERLIELYDGTGDGVVSVASARLPGAVGERMVRLDHFELLSHPDDAFRFLIEEMGWRAAKAKP